MRVECVAITNSGLVRQNNEDCLLCDGWMRNRPMGQATRFSSPDGAKGIRIFAVADGLGGHASGEVASQFALSRLDSLILDSGNVSEKSVCHALRETNKAIFAVSMSEPSYRGMGATVAGIAVDETGVVILFHVGDSRIYRRQERFLEQLTADDRQDSGGYGEKDPDEGGGTSLLQCLGGVTSPSDIDPHAVRFAMAETAETFLLCTDGLSDMLTQDEMESAVSDSLDETVANLYSLALKAGAKDNVTIMLVRLTPSLDTTMASVAPVSAEIPQ